MHRVQMSVVNCEIRPGEDGRRGSLDCKVGVTHYMRDARMASATMTPIRSVPTPDMTRLRLRHQVAFWKDLSSAGPIAWANCCSKSAWLAVGVPTAFGSRGRGRNAAIIQAVFLISTCLHSYGGISWVKTYQVGTEILYRKAGSVCFGARRVWHERHRPVMVRSKRCTIVLSDRSGGAVLSNR